MNGFYIEYLENVILQHVLMSQNTVKYTMIEDFIHMSRPYFQTIMLHDAQGLSQ